MRLKISHKTVYAYDQPVHYALLQLRLTPRDAVGQTVLSWKSHLDGGTLQLSFEDQFRNHVELVQMQDADRLEIVSEGEVEVEDRSGVVGLGRSLAPQWLFLQDTPATTAGRQVRRIAHKVEKTLGEGRALDAMHALSHEVGEAVAYAKGRTDIATTAEDAVSAGEGVCQDHAHVMIAAARTLGLAARYVSGYLLMDGVTEQEAGHAWAEVWIDDLGWVGFDVSNDICPDDRYVRVAIGRDYADAAPVHGLWQGAAREELCVSLQVQQ